MFRKIQALFSKKSTKDFEQKLSRRKLIIASFGIIISATGLTTENRKLPEPNATTGYGSDTYGA